LFLADSVALAASGRLAVQDARVGAPPGQGSLSSKTAALSARGTLVNRMDLE
jgi:hypothetical protein